MSFSSFQQCLLDHIYSSNFWSLAVLATWLYLLSPRIIPAMNLTLRQLSMHFPRSRRQYHHLPPELLVVIFVQLQQVDPPHTKKIRSKRKSPRPFRHLYREEFCDLGWLKVLHVCKQWREIAEKSPSLWNDIPNGRLPSIWIQKYLGCSHPLELSLAINMGHYPLVTATSVLDALIRDMHRTRSLTVDAVGAPYILFPHSSMSRLRSLTICGGAGSDSNTPIVPHGLSDPTTQPTIESLHLRRCLIPLHGAWTSNLVDLDVRLARGALFNVDLKPLWNLSSVALFLNGLKRLETLRLMYAFPEVQAMDHPEIYFPSSFKALSLCGNLSSGESFLSCLRLPNGATVDIAVRANPFGFPTALHPFLPLHAPAFLSLELSAPTSLTPDDPSNMGGNATIHHRPPITINSRQKVHGRQYHAQSVAYRDRGHHFRYCWVSRRPSAQSAQATPPSRPIGRASHRRRHQYGCLESLQLGTSPPAHTGTANHLCSRTARRVEYG
ncbi:hypothetical protein OF83DRAFT_744587 [Amylostereum chailletii]|nr:hypothetical protein OF83DRAFT_744587 [Amylostereum chailletii]